MVCTHVILGVIANFILFYVCVVVEGFYTYKTRHIGNDPLCLCLCCCSGYVHI